MAVLTAPSVWAGQAPGAASEPDVPVRHRDRVYAAEQFSNTASVTDPADNKHPRHPEHCAAGEQM